MKEGLPRDLGDVPEILKKTELGEQIKKVREGANKVGLNLRGRPKKRNEQK